MLQPPRSLRVVAATSWGGAREKDPGGRKKGVDNHYLACESENLVVRVAKRLGHEFTMQVLVPRKG